MKYRFENPDKTKFILDLTDAHIVQLLRQLPPEQLAEILSQAQKVTVSPAQSRPASFVKVSETDYLIFGLPYKANQILEISPSGQQTLDGNKEFYYRPQYQFDHKNNDNGHIAKEFKNFQKINKDITKCLLVPVKYEGLYTKTTDPVLPRAYDFSNPLAPVKYEGLYAKTTDMVLPKAYDFSKPENSCDVLCLPFFGNTAANSGVFAYYRRSIHNFARFAGYGTAENAYFNANFQKTLLALSERVNSK